MSVSSSSRRNGGAPINSDEYFGATIVASKELGDPTPVLAFLAQSVIETLAGIRDVEQSARWLTDGVYQQLKQKALAATRARSQSQIRELRPNLAIGKISTFSPRAGVIEGVVIVHNRGRARAVAIRLEAYNNRWRAKSVAVLQLLLEEGTTLTVIRLVIFTLDLGCPIFTWS